MKRNSPGYRARRIRKVGADNDQMRVMCQRMAQEHPAYAQQPALRDPLPRAGRRTAVPCQPDPDEDPRGQQ